MSNPNTILPPNDEMAERQVVGCCWLQPSHLDDLADKVSPDYFYNHLRRMLWEAMLRRHRARSGIDAQLVLFDAREIGGVDAQPLEVEAAEIRYHVPISAHARYYSEIVIRLGRLRQCIDAGRSLVEVAYAPAADPSDVLSVAESALAAIQTGAYNNELTDASGAATKFLVRVDEIAARGGSFGTATGFEQFDDQYGGLFPGELTVVAARTRVGKTAFACQVAEYVARSHLTYYCTLEMGAAELAGRMITRLASVSNSRVRTGKLESDDYKKLADHSGRFSSRQLRFDDKPGRKVSDIRRACLRLLPHGLKLVVVDHLGRLTPNDRRQQRYQQVGEMIRDLKELARELNVPVLCLAQLNRGAMERVVPCLEDCRESGDIEQESDLVALLYRGWYELREKGNTGKKVLELTSNANTTATLEVVKNRNGPEGAVHLHWDGPLMKFFFDTEWKP